jgi:uncharacterized protein
LKLLLYIMIFAIICLAWALIEAQLCKVTRITLNSNKINNNIKIAFLTDLHYGNYYMAGRLKNIIFKANKLKPDVIILGGDHLNIGKKSKFNRQIVEEFVSELTLLKSRYGTFSVIGNHEYYLRKELGPALDKIKQAGVKILKNTSEKVSVNGDTLLIHGIDDIQLGQADIGCLQINEEKLNILVTHNPDFFEEYNVSFDIGLSGHTHGGQVTLFGIYAPVTESKYGQKYINPINKKKNAIIITSKGLGCSGLPIRFFAVPEIIELIIEAE